MNRVIKFKIWDKQRDQFLPDNILNSIVIKYNGDFVFMTNQGPYPHPINGGQDRFILNQFTGFLDKNNKEIFDKDILKIDDELNLTVGWGYKGAWMLSDGQDWEDTFLADYAGKLEIVGNIFENKELLK